MCVCGGTCVAETKCRVFGCRVVSLFHPQIQCVAKIRDMLMSTCMVVLQNWKQIYVVIRISFKKVTLNGFTLLGTCHSISDTGGFWQIASWRAKRTHKFHSNHFCLLHDIRSFRIQWRHADIQPLWLISSYRAFGVFPFEKNKWPKKHFGSGDLWDLNIPSASSSTTTQNDLA